MHSDSSLGALYAIRDNARLAQEWTAAQTPQSFKQDRQLVYAVTRCLEIVSEASRRLPASMRERYPNLPWRAIMGVGNIYRHEYDNISEELVWLTLTQGLPTLLAAVDEEIARIAS